MASEILKIGGLDNLADKQAYAAFETDPAAKDRANSVNVSGVKKKETGGVKECETCKNRKYQDGSNDPGVSFKAPTKLSPAEAANAVVGHEREHISRDAAKAKSEGREVVRQHISVYTAVCPECGRMYISGGQATTVTQKANNEAPRAKNAANSDNNGFDFKL